MISLGIVDLVDDPANGRVKLMTLTPIGETMRIDAQRAHGGHGPTSWAAGSASRR